jgi:hypothetical protein
MPVERAVMRSVAFQRFMLFCHNHHRHPCLSTLEGIGDLCGSTFVAIAVVALPSYHIQKKRGLISIVLRCVSSFGRNEEFNL